MSYRGLRLFVVETASNDTGGTEDCNSLIQSQLRCHVSEPRPPRGDEVEPFLLIVWYRPSLGNPEEVGSIHAVLAMNLTTRHINSPLGKLQ